MKNDVESLQSGLLILSHQLELGAELMRRAAHEIELLKRMITNDPVQLAPEEGDRANG